MGVKQPFLLPGSKSQQIKQRIEGPFRLEEEQEDKTDSYTVKQCREKQNSLEPILHPDIKA
ncbi:hypothetical protein D3C73_1622110 [compost metagenome]